MAPDRDGAHAHALLPETCGMAFKEWAGVCAALADGRQSLIVRKGGIAERPSGFTPEHDAFWLYPTHVHQAEQGLRTAAPATALESPPAPAGADDRVVLDLDLLVVVDSVDFIRDEGTLDALADLHVWTEETLRRRFHYRRPGLWVLGVRVFRRATPHAIAVTPEHAGCKSWIVLDPPPATDGCTAVLDEGEFSRRRAQLRAALG
jgi:hypothetical protein